MQTISSVLEVLGELFTDIDDVKHIAQPGCEQTFNCTALVQLVCSLSTMAFMQPSPVSRSTR